MLPVAVPLLALAAPLLQRIPTVASREDDTITHEHTKVFDPSDCAAAQNAMYAAFGDSESIEEAAASSLALQHLEEGCIRSCPGKESECEVFPQVGGKLRSGSVSAVDIDRPRPQESAACTAVLDTMYNNYGQMKFALDSDTRERAAAAMHEAIEKCMQECPQHKEECLVMVGVGGGVVSCEPCETPVECLPCTPEETDVSSVACTDAHEKLVQRYGDFVYGSGASAGAELPQLVKECIAACSDKRQQEECSLFEGLYLHQEGSVGSSKGS